MNDSSVKAIFSDQEIENIRKDFPILSQKIYGKPLIYFDNAATSQKPQVVIDALTKYYGTYNANIHRGVHYLSQQASNAYDEVRTKVQQLIHAKSEREIIFTRGTTESINLVATSYGKKFLKKGDEILVSAMEHHSNIVPWQMLCNETGATLVVIPMNDKGELVFDDANELINENTKFVSVVHISNSLGTMNRIDEIIAASHKKNIPVLIDGAQSIVHEDIDVQKMDCDFFAFSGHKLFGPTGTGVLYGKMNLLEKMEPYQGGGDMISSVSFEKTTYNVVPFKFEAGTPNVADVIAMGAAIDYVQSLDRKKVAAYEQYLLEYATEKLNDIDGVKIIGEAKRKASVISFVVDGINAMDMGMYLDTQGIAVRTGQHCTEPVMDRLKIQGTIRASFLFYNTVSEIDTMISAVKKGIALLKK